MEHKEEWRSHPGTVEFVKKLKEDLKYLQECWSEGAFTTETSDGTLQLNANNIGKARAIEEMIVFIEGEDLENL